MQEKKKVVMITKTLSSYNVPIYEMVNEQVDFTFAYTLNKEVDETGFKTIKMPFYNLGPFIIYKNLRKSINQYDVVIISTHFRLLNLILLPFFPHKPKIVSWSIGRYITYNRKFDLETKPTFKDKLLRLIHEHSDACIVYTEQVIDYWRRFANINYKQYFAAHNTVKVAPFKELPAFGNRDIILFVGTLYAQKGIGELITAYANAVKINDGMPQLVIVGKGPEKDVIEGLIKAKNIEGRVVMTGAIYDENVLKDYFFRALLCVSPKQAGLSVQKSMGYGVPFVTRPDAITGGERFDIKDDYNGFFYKTEEELTRILLKTTEDTKYLEKMSNNAREFYLREASPEIMVDGVIRAINYALDK